MRDLSLHLLDLAENSVRAGANLVEIDVSVSEEKWITMTLKDDGCGMDKELLERVMSPFGTTRTTRKVGLGIPLMAQNARLTGGEAASAGLLSLQGSVPVRSGGGATETSLPERGLIEARRAVY